MDLTLLVLAAGMGSRYGSLKQIEKLGPNGERIIDYSVFDARRSGFNKIVFVIRRELEKDFNEVFIDKLSKYIEVDYVFQELDMLPAGFTCPADRVKPWGTGHAVLVARHKISGPFAIANADDFYGFEAFQVAADFFTANPDPADFTYCMVGYKLKNTLSEHGFVSRGICATDPRGYLKHVTERTSISRLTDGVYYTDGEGALQPLDAEDQVSMNFWGFKPTVFPSIEKQFVRFLSTSASNPKSEFYIPTFVDAIIKENGCSLKVLESNARWFGVTYVEDRQLVVDRLKSYADKKVYPALLW